MSNRHGYEWRILLRTKGGASTALASPENEAKSIRRNIQHKTRPVTPPNTYFDELLIDDWLHLERMNDDAWWLRVGNKRIWIRLNKNGKANVAIEDEE